MSIAHLESVRCTRHAHDRADEERSHVPTLVIPVRGVFRFHGTRRSVLADANSALVFHPDEPYRITHPADGGDACFALHVDRDAFADALGERSESSGFWTFDARAQRRLHADVRAASAATTELEREERALAILAALRPLAPPVVRRTAETRRIDAVRERLAIDLSANLSLAELARDAGVSPFHLARRFRANTGTSLHQYRLALRLASARTIVADGAVDLTTLALDHGFASLAHFSDAFRNAYGVSPSRLRGVVTRDRRARLDLAAAFDGAINT